MNLSVQIVIGALAIGGALLLLTSAIAMMRERDALSRINVLSPATGMGLPMIVLAGYVHKVALRGFSLTGLLTLLVTLAALLIVSSVASNILARSAYLAGTPVDPATHPQDLARPHGHPEG